MGQAHRVGPSALYFNVGRKKSMKKQSYLLELTHRAFILHGPS